MRRYARTYSAQKGDVCVCVCVRASLRFSIDFSSAFRP